jgi:hypothetical protein
MKYRATTPSIPNHPTKPNTKPTPLSLHLFFSFPDSGSTYPHICLVKYRLVAVML